MGDRMKSGMESDAFAFAQKKATPLTRTSSYPYYSFYGLAALSAKCVDYKAYECEYCASLCKKKNG
jgi:hypothetical protein